MKVLMVYSYKDAEHNLRFGDYLVDIEREIPSLYEVRDFEKRASILYGKDVQIINVIPLRG